MTPTMFFANQIVWFVIMPSEKKKYDISDCSWGFSYNIYLLFQLQVFQYKVIYNSSN